jgi:hypothetical protein
VCVGCKIKKASAIAHTFQKDNATIKPVRNSTHHFERVMPPPPSSPSRAAFLQWPELGHWAGLLRKD